ncbi:MAG: DUF4929 family protein [Candidatus Cryptobacteroides sp.]
MKTKSIICALAAMVVAVACNKTQDPAYEGTNYIYLSSKAQSMSEGQLTPIVVDVTLTTTLKSDLILDFEIEGKEGVLELVGTPLTIKAGEKTGQFSIVSKQAGILKEAENFKVNLAPDCVLPEKLSLKNTVSVTVSIEEASTLTKEEQEAVVEAYKTATGIDLSQYLGLVSVSVKISSYDEETEEPIDNVIEGSTNIILSEESSVECPVLKMTSNAMGIQDILYKALRASTVASEFWTDEEYYPKHIELMELTGWNADVDVSFTVSLDNIRLNSDKEIQFTGSGLDQFEEEITIVPFAYDFAPYAKELAAIENETFDKEEDYDATVNPVYWLNCYDITTNDEFESDLWVESKAVISNEKLEFTFCYSNYIDSDFNRVTVTYSPIN